MKKISSRFQPSALAMAVLCFLTPTTQAADQSIKFAVANSQLQALGIQTMALQNQSDAVKASFPAQVVIPPTAEQVVSAPLAGLIVQLLVQPNQLVRTGSPLVRIASPALGQLQLQLLQATARATLARQTAQREQALFDEGIIAQRRVQEAQAALMENEAALSQAKAALRLGGMSAENIERIATSGKLQDSITLLAPQGGTVTGIAVKPGQQVEPSTAVLTLAQTSTLWLDIQIPAAESGNWRPGTKLKVQGKAMTARLLSAGATVSAGSQTVLLRAVIEGRTDQVRPGEFVTVELPVAAVQDAWDVPLSAVARDGNQAFLFVRTTDGFEARPVKVIANAGQHVRVQGPLKAGEHIAVSGVVALKGAWIDAKEKK